MSPAGNATDGAVPVAKLTERYSREASRVDWKDSVTADCPRRAKASVAVRR